MTRAKATEKNPLIPLRMEIDEIDGALINLLARRLSLSMKIGNVKQRRGLAIHDSSREKQILSRINSQDIDDEKTKAAIADIYKEIFSQSRLVQKDPDISQGLSDFLPAIDV
ncbi:MAG: chorismate mutase [Candidatus Melainabacteria bacterium]|nr:chorismate mutase [Candidatus Melainabacteria bacterium]